MWGLQRQGKAFCFLSTTYLQGHKNVHNRRPRDTESIGPHRREGRVTEGKGTPSSLPSHPRAPRSSTATLGDTSEGRDRQTSILARAQVQVAPSEKRLLREQRAAGKDVSLH